MRPEHAIVLDPLGGGAHGTGVELAAVHPTVARAANEPGVLEDAQVLRDCRTRDLEWCREVANGCLARGEPRENRAARGIGECGEGSIQPCASGNHKVTYYRARPAGTSRTRDLSSTSCDLEAARRDLEGAGCVFRTRQL